MRISDWSSDVGSSDLWEFPGGKFEPGEMPEQALARELREELGIEVVTTQPLIRHRHPYPGRDVFLHTYEITTWQVAPRDRKSVVNGMSVTIGGDLGGCRNIKKITRKCTEMKKK